ncbi:hypothetical protein GCM10017674_38320 [Streptomyces gardneri]|uniref:Uncharacterized protein n=1 Tax=Streptomyces gardneri TaxID=66892 RepID=A0A4Y3RZZ9_9ACTN|nr:hypothetical protein SGA01_80180 [Streptomyces gardneri]GHH01728.1 hypothetical protein GCM10017674_38320 [Streptomyces gardneri]
MSPSEKEASGSSRTSEAEAPRARCEAGPRTRYTGPDCCVPCPTPVGATRTGQSAGDPALGRGFQERRAPSKVSRATHHHPESRERRWVVRVLHVCAQTWERLPDRSVSYGPDGFPGCGCDLP